jgi:hypothetical protein
MIGRRPVIRVLKATTHGGTRRFGKTEYREERKGGSVEWRRLEILLGSLPRSGLAARGDRDLMQGVAQVK